MTIIVNPISGEGASWHKAQLLAGKLRRRGLPCQVRATAGPGHGRELAAESAEGSRTVVAVGGDGTVNEVVCGLAGTDTPLTVLPTGTANVLAHELGIGKHVSATVNTLCRGKPRRMDLGRVITHPQQSRTREHFVCLASCGFDAAVTRAMQQYRGGKNITYAHYVPIALKAFCDYTYPELSVMLDGRPWPRKAYHVLISNTRSYGGPFRIATHAEFDDGLFDVVLLEKGGPFWLSAYAAALIVRAHLLLPGVKMVRAKTVRVTSECPAPCQLDGDFVGHTPLAVEIAPAALVVLVAEN